ncbi:Zn(2)-C6 fungal-type domain-containing protein [Mycena indigotica]|uniref:Zn(2)-C6 fungal-type domain-containing protein n=1 Tax=Mycena indigotica TaxID=2126181 RepID=A0A8H6VTT8_9AGAR|nr:Zn(2)-C6 fungal-type domain-containing protein [Mycena indigotica]KAF7293702.1 Zn(2)-C6 fungal-type domain-containing protein [Mycena indigotica]
MLYIRHMYVYVNHSRSPSFFLVPPPPRMATQTLTPPHNICLPSYKELALAADIDGPCAGLPLQPLPRPTSIVLPPLEVPSRPLRKQDGFGAVHDHFLDLARQCPAAPPPNKEWTSPSPYSAYRPTSSSFITPVMNALPTPIRVSTTNPSHSIMIHHMHQPQPQQPPPQYDRLVSDVSEPFRCSHAMRPKKKQVLSCSFCRKRKIACRRPEDGSIDERCHECARRNIGQCAYATARRVSLRGKNSRRKSAGRVGNIHHDHQGAGPEMELGSPLPSPERKASASPLSTRMSCAAAPASNLHKLKSTRHAAMRDAATGNDAQLQSSFTTRGGIPVPQTNAW